MQSSDDSSRWFRNARYLSPELAVNTKDRRTEMPISERGIPKIKIIFKGFFISRIKDGNSIAEIGALSDSACHRPRISVLKSGDNGLPPTVENVVFDIDQNIEVKIENTDLTTIKEFRKDPFDRKSDNT